MTIRRFFTTALAVLAVGGVLVACDADNDELETANEELRVELDQLRTDFDRLTDDFGVFQDEWNAFRQGVEGAANESADAIRDAGEAVGN